MKYEVRNERLGMTLGTLTYDEVLGKRAEWKRQYHIYWVELWSGGRLKCTVATF